MSDEMRAEWAAVDKTTKMLLGCEQRIAGLEAQAEALKNALSAFEWGGKCFGLERDLCPVCGHIRRDGHHSECWLAAALQGRDKLGEITDALDGKEQQQ